MKIAIVGMGRSGSTALYNIVRIILNQKKIKYHSDYRETHFPKVNSVIKWHDYNETLKNDSDIIFTTKRELKDCLGSHYRYTGEIKGERTLKELCDQYLSYHIIWKDYSSYEFVYEDYKKDPNKIVKEVAAVLGYNNINSEEVLKKLKITTESIIKGNSVSGFQSPTLIFKNHVTNGTIGSYKNHLTEEEIKWINENYSEWLKSNGYLT